MHKTCYVTIELRSFSKQCFRMCVHDSRQKILCLDEKAMVTKQWMSCKRSHQPWQRTKCDLNLKTIYMLNQIYYKFPRW